MPHGGTIFNERGSHKYGNRCWEERQELIFKHTDLEICTDCPGGDTQEEIDNVGLNVWRELWIGNVDWKL